MTVLRQDAGRPEDPLLEVAPAIWMGLLTGADLPDEGGTIVCPFGDCGSPSFRVFASGRDGFRCDGECGRHGSILVFAADWFDTSPRDLDLVRERLTMALLSAPVEWRS